MRGKLAEATELLDGAIEAGRLLGTPPALAGNLFNRSVVALAVGDLDIALATAEEGVEVTRELDAGFVTAWAAVRLAGVVLETGQPVRAVELLLARAGGEELTLIPGGWRAYCLELLTRCRLALDQRLEAERAAGMAEAMAAAARLPLAFVWADRAAAAVSLHCGDTDRAIERALASAECRSTKSAPPSRPRCRAPSRAGRWPTPARPTGPSRNFSGRQRRSTPAARWDTATARSESWESSATARIGARARARPTDPASTRLTERELQVARLVVDRKTNPEIAAELFLSQKTVETHLRNIFNKTGVATRVALARAVEHSDGTRGADRT